MALTHGLPVRTGNSGQLSPLMQNASDAEWKECGHSWWTNSKLQQGGLYLIYSRWLGSFRERQWYPNFALSVARDRVGIPMTKISYNTWSDTDVIMTFKVYSVFISATLNWI